MSNSSGIRQDSRIAIKDCENTDHCVWAGEVDENYDPETYTAWWTCPSCGHHHDTSISFFIDERAEDA